MWADNLIFIRKFVGNHWFLYDFEFYLDVLQMRIIFWKGFLFVDYIV